MYCTIAILTDEESSVMVTQCSPVGLSIKWNFEGAFIDGVSDIIEVRSTLVCGDAEVGKHLWHGYCIMCRTAVHHIAEQPAPYSQ